MTIANRTSLDALVSRIELILTEARTNVIRTVNSQMVRAHWLIGREIIEEEQKGRHRAGYSESIIENLSTSLMQEHGKGFTPTNLKYMRLFYLTYPNLLTKEIRHAARDQSMVPGSFNENLSWTHYRLLTKVESNLARSFYEIETVRNRWSSRELERQFNSLLFERLAKSRDKRGVLALAARGHEIQKLSHADLGQMQLYVNYYDEQKRTTGDNPTIGLILCTDKNDAVVKYTLGKGSRQIFASRYKLYLPTEKELVEEMRRELMEANKNHIVASQNFKDMEAK
ncbi:MAG: PDDEXK nuclease domain-containing protein [bacterium]